jgi:hypothetical protein
VTTCLVWGSQQLVPAILKDRINQPGKPITFVIGFFWQLKFSKPMLYIESVLTIIFERITEKIL